MLNPADEIAKTIRTLLCPGCTYEVRVLNVGGRRRTDAGWFDDFEALAREVNKYLKKPATGIYCTLNPVTRECLSLAHNRIKEWADTTTGDRDIERRLWLMIDLDPARRSGISSTEAELRAAQAKAVAVMEFLESLGFPNAVVAMSGNGIHLLFRVDLPNDEASRILLEKCLKVLDAKFSDSAVKIDTAVANAARITKFYGTVARKGDNTKERPHRISHLLPISPLPAFADVPIVPTDRLEALAALALEQTGLARGAESGRARRQAKGAASGPFDMGAFINLHGIAVRGSKPWEGGVIYPLEHCLFDASHIGTSACLGVTKDGAPFHKCQHDSCQGKRWADVQALFEPGEQRQVSVANPAPVSILENKLAKVLLPGRSTTISKPANKLGVLLAEKGSIYIRGGAVVKVVREPDDLRLKVLKPASFSSLLETVAVLFKENKDGEIEPAICDEATARLIMASEAFQETLPPVQALSRCPLLVERCDGSLDVVTSYDEKSGVLVEGGDVEEPTSIEQAKIVLLEALYDFKFATPSDLSRAVAGLITPSLVLPGLATWRSPLNLSEADQSQAGKGYLTRITAAFYRQVPYSVTQRRGGVGSLEETFNQTLVEGRGFISLDNIRGLVDFPSIESFLTEPTYYARVPYAGNVRIDSRRTVVFFTSNKAELTRDMANRSSAVRILKQADNYRFRSYPEGAILEHIIRHQPRFLGAVFRIIREWCRRGKPVAPDAGHDFRGWARTLRYIVEDILGLPPLLDGHRLTVERMANPRLNWLRDVGLLILSAGRADQWIRTYELLEILDDHDAEIPGLKPGECISDNAVWERVLRVTGKWLASAMKDDVVDLGDMVVERQGDRDTEGRIRRLIRVCRKPNNPAFPASGNEAV